ncbi:unnamed protein product [Symbiodinium sp. CCMP2592]|nr:unnamed protein product [Symbiodinium sp. CCMP2592]
MASELVRSLVGHDVPRRPSWLSRSPALREKGQLPRRNDLGSARDKGPSVCGCLWSRRPAAPFGPETSDVSKNPTDRDCQKILFAMAPPVLTHDLALEIQDKLIGEFTQPAFRYKLRDALDGSEGDIMKQAHARRDVCLAVEIPLLAKYGYDASEEGIHQHSAAMALLLKDCPDLVVKNNELARLVNPTMDVDEDTHITAD